MYNSPTNNRNQLLNIYWHTRLVLPIFPIKAWINKLIQICSAFCSIGNLSLSFMNIKFPAQISTAIKAQTYTDR